MADHPLEAGAQPIAHRLIPIIGRCLLFACGLLVVFASGHVYALTYECVDKAGTTMFTDNPSQLKHCATATKTRPSPLPSHASSFPATVKGADEEGAMVSPLLLHAPFSLPPDGKETGEGQMSIPVTKVGRLLVVHAKLNGTRDAKLIVDTGAEITVLSHAVALDIGLFPSTTIATVTLTTPGGSVRADTFRVGTVSVGTAEIRDVMVAVHDMPDAPPGVDGLLGLTVLNKFLMTLDTQKGELHLKQRE